jgi:hypothetical protein
VAAHPQGKADPWYYWGDLERQEVCQIKFK